MTGTTVEDAKLNEITSDIVKKNVFKRNTMLVESREAVKDIRSELCVLMMAMFHATVIVGHVSCYST